MSYKTIVADPPWRFSNRTGKAAPEHSRLFRYPTMTLEDICAMGPQVLEQADDESHLYLWVPTALLNWGLEVVAAWGYDYKTAVYWHKVSADGTSDRSCMGFYYRNVVEPCLFGIRGKVRTQHYNVANLFEEKKREHSRKPEAFYDLVEHQSLPDRLELFARQQREGWTGWGNDAVVNGGVLITTDPDSQESWREVVADVLGSHGGRPVPIQSVYAAAEGYAKVSRAKTLGHKWHAQIRRTLQKHFEPAGYAQWRTA
jgi:N6-adenosine-specific RNA methylase IME4